MESTLIISVVVLNLALLIVVGLLVFIILKLIKDKNNIAGSPQPIPHASQNNKKIFHPDIQKRMDEIQFTNPVRDDIFCPYHPTEAGEVQCGMCSKYFCAKCVRPMKSIYFCKEHMALHMRLEWDEVLTLKTSSDDPEAGVRLYQKKQEIFEKFQIPTFIETHYKINVDDDYIETYLVLYGEKNRLEEIKKIDFN